MHVVRRLTAGRSRARARMEQQAGDAMVKHATAFGFATFGAAAFCAGVFLSMDGRSPSIVSGSVAQAAGTPTAWPTCPVRSADGPDEVLIRAGVFTMGSDTERPEEKVAHPVGLSAFYIDRHEVTNDQFAAFVDATGYVTIAERGLGDVGRGHVPDALRRPGGMVFAPPTTPVTDLTDVTKWWQWVEGANWREPEGPGSTIEGKGNHPVVQVSIEDAYAYAKWAGRALPSEAQWEYAARGGLEGATYAWGNTFDEPDGTKATTWQGAFPHADAAIDGAHGTAPVGCYDANDYGLHDMAGNVWEYVANWWVPHHAGEYAIDPKGPLPRSAAPYGNFLGPRVTVKGGSWLCSPMYCARFRPSGRQPQELAISSNHIGFRTVRVATGSTAQ